MEHYIRLTTNSKIDLKKLNLLSYMIEKFSSIVFIEELSHQSGTVYNFELSNSIDEKDMEILVNFWYNKFNDDVYFENSVDRDISDDTTDEMIYELSKYMHNHMVKEKLNTGWTYGEKFSMDNKTSPLLKDFDSIPEDYKILRPDVFSKVLEILNK